MKIIIKAGKEKSKIEIPQNKVREMYDKILMVISLQKYIWKTGIHKENEAPPDVSSPPKIKPIILPPDPPKEVHVTVTTPNADGYKGLIVLKCPSCEKQFVVFKREPAQSVLCRCGAEILFDDMARVHHKCPKCEEFRYYWTNRKELIFEMACGACHAVSDVEYSYKHQMYKSPELFGSKK